MLRAAAMACDSLQQSRAGSSGACSATLATVTWSLQAWHCVCAKHTAAAAVVVAGLSAHQHNTGSGLLIVWPGIVRATGLLDDDPDGDLRLFSVVHISRRDQGVVTVRRAWRSGESTTTPLRRDPDGPAHLKVGDVVSFTGVRGMEELNGGEVHRITAIPPLVEGGATLLSFCIGNTSAMGTDPHANKHTHLYSLSLSA